MDYFFTFAVQIWVLIETNLKHSSLQNVKDTIIKQDALEARKHFYRIRANMERDVPEIPFKLMT